MKINKVAGIDLGTTNSLATIMNLEDADIIKYSSEHGRTLVPSVLAYHPKEKKIVVGHAAFIRRGTNPEPVVSIKRQMGKKENLKIGPYEMNPEEISADILKETIRQLQVKLSEIEESGQNNITIDRAIITVPAYFDNPQTEATHEAGRIAGLKVMELLHEPTAAAIYYSWKRNIKDATFMVFDLGGGTFDVSIIKRVAGEPKVVGIAGDNFLGGDDFDRKLANYILDALKNDKESPYSLDLDIKNNLEDRLKFSKMIMLAEGVKKELSKEDVVKIDNSNLFLDNEGLNVVVDMAVTRDTFNGLIKDQVDSTIPCCVEALLKAKKEGGISLDQIDNIIMIGGSTYIPLVREKVKAVFCSNKDIEQVLPKDMVNRKIKELFLGREEEKKTITEEYLEMDLKDFFYADGKRLQARCNEPDIDDPEFAVSYGAAIRAASYGIEMYDDNNKVVVSLRNLGGTSGSTYNLSGNVRALDETIDLNNGIIRVSTREGGFTEEKTLENRGRFSFKKIPLQESNVTNFDINVFDANGNEVAALSRSVQQSTEHKTIGSGVISPAVLSKSIYIEVVKDSELRKEVLFKAITTTLPADTPPDSPFRFYTRDQSGLIRVPFYQGNQEINIIEVEVDTTLPVGSPVEFYLHIDEKYNITGHGEVSGKRFPIDIKPPAEEDFTEEDYNKLCNEFEEALHYLPGGQKMIFKGKKNKICKDIEEALKANDKPKLSQRGAELKGLIKEMQIREKPLEPPKVVFDRLILDCNDLGKLASELLQDFDDKEWEATVETQRKFGEEAYISKDQQRYGECYANLIASHRHLSDRLRKVIKTPELTDEERAMLLVSDLKKWLELLEPMAEGIQKPAIVQELKKHASKVAALEPLCTADPHRVIKDGQIIITELQKIYKQMERELRPEERDRFEGILTTGKT